MTQKIVNIINKKFKPLIKLLKRMMLAQSILLTLVFLCRFSLNQTQLMDYFNLVGSHPLTLIILFGLGITSFAIFLMILSLMIMSLSSVILDPSIILRWFKKLLRRILFWVREIEKQE